MPADELDTPLDTPLGKRKAAIRLKLPLPAPQLLSILLGTSVVAVGLWTVFGHDPYGGEPIAVVPTKSPTTADSKDQAVAAAVKNGTAQPRPAGSGANAPLDPTVRTSPPPGSKTVTIIDGSSGKKQEVVVPAKSVGGGTSATISVPQKLLETSRHGFIPKIAPDGSRSSHIFSHPVALDAAKNSFPKIALIIGNLGVSASSTAEALERLPQQVTLAFTPYATNVERLVTQASSRQHEILLQVPMEPFDFPDNDPGPQTLLTSLSKDQNIDRLHWQMSRMKGYVGIVGFMGARFSISDQALSPIMSDVAKRGLIYVDNAASKRSVASQIAGSQNLPFARADVVIDAVPTIAEIDRALKQLETIARDRGTAVGIASALPAAIARIADWVEKAKNRGIILVPISMVAIKAKQS